MDDAVSVPLMHFLQEIIVAFLQIVGFDEAVGLVQPVGVAMLGEAAQEMIFHGGHVAAGDQGDGFAVAEGIGFLDGVQILFKFFKGSRIGFLGVAQLLEEILADEGLIEHAVAVARQAPYVAFAVSHSG